MSRSWHNPWGPELRFRESRTDNWKQQIKKELDEVAAQDTGVFIIVNEWTDDYSNDFSEIVNGKYFTSEDEAWDHLVDIADAHELSLPKGSTSVDLPPSKGVQRENYHIEELTRA